MATWGRGNYAEGAEGAESAEVRGRDRENVDCGGYEEKIRFRGTDEKTAVQRGFCKKRRGDIVTW